MADQKYLISAGKTLSSLILLIGIILIASGIIDVILTAEFISIDGTEILWIPNLYNDIVVSGFGVVLAVFGVLLLYDRLTLLVFNVVISLYFLGFNVMLWGDYASIFMYPFVIHWVPPWYGGPIVLPNFLFWLFWLSTAVNVYFIIKHQRTKETKSNT